MSNLGLLEETEREHIGSNLEDTWRRFVLFFVRDEIFITKETKLLKNRAVGKSYFTLLVDVTGHLIYRDVELVGKGELVLVRFVRIEAFKVKLRL